MWDDTNHVSRRLKKVEDSLQRIPFFSGLPPDALSAIAAKLRHERYVRDEVVFVEGSLGDSLYFIESGQVKVTIGSGPNEKIVTYLGPGNFFGEMALFLNQRRTASVTTVIDADVWVLRKDDLDELLKHYPSIALLISRELSRRLTATLQQPVREEEYNLVAVAGSKTWRLAASLAHLTGERVILYNLADTPLVDQTKDSLPDEVIILDAMPGLSGEDLAESLGILADAYDRVLLAIPAEQREIAVKAMQLAEVVVLIDLEQPAWMANLSQAPVISVSSAQWSVDRTARFLTRRVVGLALSSGGARGIAHVGVLRVLEREGIPIDILAGTSIGALIGALYAAGHAIDDIARFTLNLDRKLGLRGGLFDLNFPPRGGLVRGERFRTYLEQMLQGITFEELKIPLYVVATDVVTGEEVVFDSGPVADAVRASTSIVGLVSPHQFNSRYLVDGGAVNPLPGSVLSERGANLVLASRAIPSLEDEREGAESSRGWKNLNNILGVFSNYLSIMEREIIKTRLDPIDVMIHPRVGVYSAMDYHQAADLIRFGEEAAMQAVDSIKQKVYARK
jgi:NTE family protein